MIEGKIEWNAFIVQIMGVHGLWLACMGYLDYGIYVNKLCVQGLYK